jgi:hypothetical protein
MPVVRHAGAERPARDHHPALAPGQQAGGEVHGEQRRGTRRVDDGDAGVRPEGGPGQLDEPAMVVEIANGASQPAPARVVDHPGGVQPLRRDRVVELVAPVGRGADDHVAPTDRRRAQGGEALVQRRGGQSPHAGRLPAGGQFGEPLGDRRQWIDQPGEQSVGPVGLAFGSTQEVIDPGRVHLAPVPDGDRAVFQQLGIRLDVGRAREADATCDDGKWFERARRRVGCGGRGRRFDAGRQYLAGRVRAERRLDQPPDHPAARALGEPPPAGGGQVGDALGEVQRADEVARQDRRKVPLGSPVAPLHRRADRYPRRTPAEVRKRRGERADGRPQQRRVEREVGRDPAGANTREAVFEYRQLSRRSRDHELPRVVDDREEARGPVGQEGDEVGPRRVHREQAAIGRGVFQQCPCAVEDDPQSRLGREHLGEYERRNLADAVTQHQRRLAVPLAEQSAGRQCAQINAQLLAVDPGRPLPTLGGQQTEPGTQPDRDPRFRLGDQPTEPVESARTGQELGVVAPLSRADENQPPRVDLAVVERRERRLGQRLPAGRHRPGPGAQPVGEHLPQCLAAAEGRRREVAAGRLGDLLQPAADELGHRGHLSRGLVDHHDDLIPAGDRPGVRGDGPEAQAERPEPEFVARHQYGHPVAQSHRREVPRVALLRE